MKDRRELVFGRKNELGALLPEAMAGTQTRDKLCADYVFGTHPELQQTGTEVLVPFPADEGQCLQLGCRYVPRLRRVHE